MPEAERQIQSADIHNMRSSRLFIPVCHVPLPRFQCGSTGGLEKTEQPEGKRKSIASGQLPLAFMSIARFLDTSMAEPCNEDGSQTDVGRGGQGVTSDRPFCSVSRLSPGINHLPGGNVTSFCWPDVSSC